MESDGRLLVKAFSKLLLGGIMAHRDPQVETKNWPWIERPIRIICTSRKFG